MPSPLNESLVLATHLHSHLRKRLIHRSSYDQFHVKPGSPPVGLCCEVDSMQGHYAEYTAEAYGIYLALATDSNVRLTATAHCRLRQRSLFIEC